MERTWDLFLAALRTEVEAGAEDGPGRRQKLAAAGRKLGKEGLTDRDVAPGQWVDI